MKKNQPRPKGSTVNITSRPRHYRGSHRPNNQPRPASPTPETITQPDHRWNTTQTIVLGQVLADYVRVPAGRP